MQNPQLNPWPFLATNSDVGTTLEDVVLSHGGQVEDVDLSQNASLETAAIPVRNRGLVQFYLENSGAAALTNFALLGKTHPVSEWVTLLSGTDWNSHGHILIHKATSAGNVSTLAAGATAIGKVDVRGMWAVKFQASCGTSTEVAIAGQLATM